MKNFWLVKQEPSAYSWANFVADGKTPWTGVRNYTARNNLRAMRKGDAVLFYHSVSEKSVVGTARVSREAYADPTATEGDWSAVDLAPENALGRPMTLEEIKRDEWVPEGHQHRHFGTMDVAAGGDAVSGRIPLFYNADVTFGVVPIATWPRTRPRAGADNLREACPRTSPCTRPRS